MKILQVITSLQTGGAEKIVTELSLALIRKGHKVDVAVFNGIDTSFKKFLLNNGCRVICFSKNGNPYNLLNIFRLCRIMSDYDIIHTHNTSPQFFAAIANIFSHRKIVTTEHSTNNRRRNKKWLRFIDKWMYRQYDSVVCISNIAKEKLDTYLKDSKVNTCTINNGVDVGKFYNATPIRELRKENDFVITMVAGLKEAKDHDTLLRAIALLPDEYKLWLVGDGVRRNVLENLVNDLNIKDRVSFMGFRDDIPSILKTADVIVMSSHWEGLSLSNIEGMSSMKPFIASDVNGLREVTKGYGILFPHQNAEALAEAIKHLHDDTNFYNNVASDCYERAKQFDISYMVDSYEHIYNELKS
jgi:glycosyltransferase involved in cell wall biosynthesis